MYSDLSSKSLKETGVFKMLTGGDLIDGERKFVQGRVKFKNHAKLIFSCNQIPPVTSDDTTAFWRRWNITKFLRVFDEENADKNLLEKLTDPPELSSLLNDAIDGLKRLIQNGRFSNYKNVEETRYEYISKSDPIWGFAEQKLVIESDSYEPKRIVYEAYTEYCRQRKLPIAPSNVFSRDLKKFVAFRDGQRMVDGKKVTCYVGIELVDKKDGIKEEPKNGLTPWVERGDEEPKKGKKKEGLPLSKDIENISNINKEGNLSSDCICRRPIHEHEDIVKLANGKMWHRSCYERYMERNPFLKLRHDLRIKGTEKDELDPNDRKLIEWLKRGMTPKRDTDMQRGEELSD
jgi:putative DNA primase/helicase